MIPTAPDGADGALVTRAGQVQYGAMLLGTDTAARWRELVGWRDLPEVDVEGEPRPQAHGAYPGRVLAGSNTTTYTFLLRGSREDKLADLAIIEAHTQPDGVERPLVVDDGGGPTLRWGRVIGRNLPQGRHFRHEPVECSLQWRCADPRRYSLTQVTATAALPMASGGVEYPAEYPLDYGVASSGSVAVTHEGTTPAPVLVTFAGPLTNPQLSAPGVGWVVGLNLELAAGETVTVDTSRGTVLLNGDADRLYALTTASTPLGDVSLPPDTTTSLTLTAAAGTGTASLTYRHAYL